MIECGGYYFGVVAARGRCMREEGRRRISWGGVEFYGPEPRREATREGATFTISQALVTGDSPIKLEYVTV